MKTVLCTQGCESRTRNKKSELSIRRWHNLEPAVYLHGFWGDRHRWATFAGHLWGGSTWYLCHGLSESQCTWVRCIEVQSVDLGHAGGQVTEEASPNLCVHTFTRGQEAGDLSNALTEAGSVFSHDGRVRVHSSCQKTIKIYKYTVRETDAQVDR